MSTKTIKTESDYRAALAEIEALKTAKQDTPEGEKLALLVAIVEAYEAKNYLLD